MDIKTKFSIGDTVYFIFHNMIYGMKKCPLCDGDKSIMTGPIRWGTRGKKKIECPRCEGFGRTSNNHEKKYVTHGEISYMNVNVRKHSYKNTTVLNEFYGVTVKNNERTRVIDGIKLYKTKASATRALKRKVRK